MNEYTSLTLSFALAAVLSACAHKGTPVRNSGTAATEPTDPSRAQSATRGDAVSKKRPLTPDPTAAPAATLQVQRDDPCWAGTQLTASDANLQEDGDPWGTTVEGEVVFRELVLEQPRHLWMSLGPDRSLASLLGAELVLQRTCSRDEVPLARGPTIAVDLEAGRYFVSVQARQLVDPTPEGFVWRLSEPGDSRCPANFSRVGLYLDDELWKSEIKNLGDLNGDGQDEWSFKYRAGVRQWGTRVVSTRPYPECAHVVFDDPALIQVRPQRHAGWRELAASYHQLNPAWGGGWVNYSAVAAFDAALGRFKVERYQSCSDSTGSPAPGRLGQACLTALGNQISPSAGSVLARFLRGPATSPTTGMSKPSVELQHLRRADASRDHVVEVGPTRECRSLDGPRRWVTKVNVRGPEIAGPAEDDWKLPSDQPYVVSILAGSGIVLESVVSEHPCPRGEDGDDAVQDFMVSWLEQPWSSARGDAPAHLASLHTRLAQLWKNDVLFVQSIRSCHSPKDRSTWIWEEPVTGDDGEVEWLSLLIERVEGKMRIASAPDTRPLFCDF